MPIYSVRNKETGEVFDAMMKIADREKYLEDNPSYEFIITQAPSIGDPIRLGLKKPSDAFRDRLREIHKNVPGSVLKDNSSFI